MCFLGRKSKLGAKALVSRWRRTRLHSIEALESRRLLSNIGVFGQDTRYPVPADAILPRADWFDSGYFAAVGQVITRYGQHNNDSGSCSGVLISPRVVLTNAHCVVRASNYAPTRYPRSIEFYPGRHRDDSSPFGVVTATASQLRISPDYLRNPGPTLSNPNSTNVYNDYALIMLGTDIGRLTGWMDIAVRQPSFFSDSMLVSAGYPGEKIAPSTGVNAMYVTAGPSLRASSQGNYGTIHFAGRDYTDRGQQHPYSRFNPACVAAQTMLEKIRWCVGPSGFDITPGQSGSPIWHTSVSAPSQLPSSGIQRTRHVVGLVTASNGQQNFGTAITPYVYNQILGWMGQQTAFPVNPVFRPATGFDIPETPVFKPDLTDYDRYFDTDFNHLLETNVARGIEVGFSFRAYNAGSYSVPSGSVLRVFASRDNALSEDDVLVAEQMIPEIARFQFADTMGTMDTQKLLPGAYHLIWQLESASPIGESDLDNNIGMFADILHVSAIPPILKLSEEKLYADELTPFVFHAYAFDPFRHADAELSLRSYQLPKGASFAVSPTGDGEVRGTFLWTPAKGQSGVFHVRFEASLHEDDTTAIYKTLEIEVLDSNSAPFMRPFDDQVVAIGQSLPISVFVDDPDGAADADLAVVHHTELPDGAIFDQQTRPFGWTPTVGQVGEHRIEFWATDLGGLESERRALKIRVVRPALSITIDNPVLTVESSSSLITFNFTASVPWFDEDDILVSGGTLRNLSGSGTYFTATFAAWEGYEGNGTIEVRNESGILDIGANDTNLAELEVDTLPPLVAFRIDADSIRYGSTAATVWFEFSEPVLGFDLDSLSVSGGLVTDMIGKGKQYTATFIADDGVEQTGLITVKGAYRDLAGNQGRETSRSFAVNTLAPNLNFGDAPTAAQSGFPYSYPVTLAQNGARHAISDLFLGASFGDSVDGVPSVDANGTPSDDGVQFLTSVVAADVPTLASVRVLASASGKLDAWVDFNRDGRWLGDEQIFQSVPVNEGVNLLAFEIPVGASTGLSFARFRLSSTGGLSPIGFAADGEVEDYPILIAEGRAPTTVIAEIVDGNVSLVSSGGTQALLTNGAERFRAPIESLLSIQVEGSENDDQITLNLSEHYARLAGGLAINGGGGDNVLVLAGAGWLDLTDSQFDFRNIEKIVLSAEDSQHVRIDAINVAALSPEQNAVEVILGHTQELSVADADQWRLAPRRPDELDRMSAIHHATGTEITVVTAHPLTNFLQPTDVNNNGENTPLDALIILNTLSREQRRQGMGTTVTVDSLLQFGEHSYVDVNRDGIVTPLDALIVLSRIARAGRAVDGEMFEQLAPPIAPAVLAEEDKHDFRTRQMLNEVVDSIVSPADLSNVIRDEVGDLRQPTFIEWGHSRLSDDTGDLVDWAGVVDEAIQALTESQRPVKTRWPL